MTLHEAIIKLLEEEGPGISAKEIALRLNDLGWYKKQDGSKILSTQIHSRANKYRLNFYKDEGKIFLKKES